MCTWLFMFYNFDLAIYHVGRINEGLRQNYYYTRNAPFLLFMF